MFTLKIESKCGPESISLSSAIWNNVDFYPYFLQEWGGTVKERMHSVNGGHFYSLHGTV